MFGKRKQREQETPAQAKCSELLKDLQGLLKDQRMTLVGKPEDNALAAAIKEKLERSGQLEQVKRNASERDVTTERLMKTYGDCVRKVEGADPQDLYTLHRMGLLPDPLA